MAPRVALLLPYWTFWEPAVPYDLRAEREALADRAAAALPVEVVARATAASPEEAEAAGRLFVERGADALLVLSSMAVPPLHTLPALGAAPVVVWVVHRDRRVADDFDHARITSEGATVGGPLLTASLVRERRPFDLVVGLLDDGEAHRRVGEALRAAAAAGRLRRARVGRVGRPLPGYASVDADDQRLRAEMGVEPVHIEPAEFRERYLAVAEARVREVERETRERYDVRIEGEGLERSLRAAVALEELAAAHRLDAGAFNCHVPEIRLGREVGIAPCFALGRETSRGSPWTCVGDVLTAVAMLTTTLLGGASQYHELEALDYETGELVVASSGEFDLRLAPDARPELVPNGWFASDACTGACACFGVERPGPATLVGFAQLADGFRLVAAEGEFTGRTWPGVGTANGAFRFARGARAWEDWCRAGSNHHSSATPGALGDAVEAVARHLGIDCVRV